MSTQDEQDRTVEQEGTPTGVPIVLSGTPEGIVQSRAKALPPEDDHFCMGSQCPRCGDSRGGDGSHY